MATNPSPEEAPTAPLGRRTAPTVAEAEREGTLLLIADDHPTNRMVLLRQVNALGYAAEAVEDGTQALEAWRSGRYAAIVTDCHMPGMSGYDLARRVREIEGARGQPRTPILACTANALPGEAEKCFTAGMDDYLAKPIRLVDLAQRLDRWLPLAGAWNLPIPSPEPPPAHGTPIDEAVLAENTLGDAQLAREALRGFRRDIGADSARLLSCVARETPEAAAEAAHRIKGASRLIGALKLAEICERVEAAALRKDFAAVRQELPKLGEESAIVVAYLARRSSSTID